MSAIVRNSVGGQKTQTFVGYHLAVVPDRVKIYNRLTEGHRFLQMFVNMKASARIASYAVVCGRRN